MAVTNLNIQFKSNTRKVQGNTGQFIENASRIENRTAEELAEDLEDAIKESVRRKFDRFEGDLHDNVDAHKKGDTADGVRYEVTANAYSDDNTNYAAWHEYSKKSHYAYYTDRSDNPNRELIKWAKMRGIYDDTWRLEVTPINKEEGSFMEPAVTKAIGKMRKRMRSSQNAASVSLAEFFD
jgi:hypothetical protein